MNENKLKQLFAAARRAPAPTPPADFAEDVLRAARQLPSNAHTLLYEANIFEQLNSWFPRLALASAALIILCAALELGYTSNGTNTADDDSQQSNQIFYSIDDA